ncbi:MAG TPA: aminotransferase class I/II-fold pyridoxal phosphate-dependent enzyme [Vicinamibacterales bacterium]|nr:aminotransferase class I/II-fold pyridoxal phosphate-dependent enzyme [Vicinamibacterales bacterium]
MTALAGAVGSGSSFAAPLAGAGVALAAANGTFDFDTPYNRFGTDSTKYDQQIRVYGKDAIQVGMGIADMDFKVAPAITKALMERIQHENWGYLDMGGALGKSMNEHIVSWNKKRYGINVNPDSVVLTTGVHPGIVATLRAFCPVGSKVLLNTPTYNGFYGDLTATKTVPEEVPMRLVNGRYSIDFDEFERHISGDTNAYILCNPQNPTGNTWSQEDLMKLGEVCLKHRVVVLPDEIHCDFVQKGQKYTPFATLPDKAIVNNSVTFKAASKSFGLAAMKCAWFFSTNQSFMERIKPYNRADLTTLGIISSHAAYTGGEDWLNQCVEYIDGNHDFAVSYIKANIPTIKLQQKAQGTYLTWLDVTEVAERIGARQMADEANKKLKDGAKALTPEQMVERWFVRHAKVHMNAGNSYGLGGANHMRMNIATSRKTLELALSNLAGALKNPSPDRTLLD